MLMPKNRLYRCRSVCSCAQGTFVGLLSDSLLLPLPLPLLLVLFLGRLLLLLLLLPLLLLLLLLLATITECYIR